ncbi:hypothetical protein JDN40_00265, partial [Rhodomicrobium vannielii ATCC 17100]|uniref:hypothetical protein n=1 Tax=Rhodomicrobium vannielii TaxID=1069 RepID=UPI001919736E
EIHRLIGKVAKRHRIILAPGDPLFVVLTLLELVTDRYLEKADAILTAERDASLDAMERAAASAKTTGEGLITAAADYVAKTVRSSTAELTDALTSAAAAERAKIELAAKDGRRVVWIGATLLAILFSILTGIAIGIWLAPDANGRFLNCPISEKIASASQQRTAATERHAVKVGTQLTLAVAKHYKAEERNAARRHLLVA